MEKVDIPHRNEANNEHSSDHRNCQRQPLRPLQHKFFNIWDWDSYYLANRDEGWSRLEDKAFILTILSDFERTVAVDVDSE